MATRSPKAAPYPGPANGCLPVHSLEELGAALPSCRGCDIAENDSQPVFGLGPADARVVMVGEQPGDIEERRGLPFVGPAGKVLDRALEAAGIDRSTVWVTNSVLHFKFTQDGPGKRRIHQTPDVHEVAACKPWLEAQLNRLRPELVVLLGATAAKSLLGAGFRVTKERGTAAPGAARLRRSADRHDPSFGGAPGAGRGARRYVRRAGQ